jgi:hypothetical protein
MFATVIRQSLDPSEQRNSQEDTGINLFDNRCKSIELCENNVHKFGIAEAHQTGRFFIHNSMFQPQGKNHPNI